MDYRIETRTCLIDDIEIVDQYDGHLVVLNCITSKGARFSTAIQPKPLGRGWRYEQFRLIQKMLAAYNRECDATERDHYDMKPIYAGLMGLYFKLRLKVGPCKNGERQIQIEKFRRCDAFTPPDPDGMSVEDFLAMMEGEE